MSLIAEQPSTIAKVLDTSFKLYTVSFKKLIVLAIFISLVALAMNFVVQLVAPGLENGDDPAAALQALPTILGMFLFYIIVTMVTYVAMIYRIDNLVNGYDDTLGEAMGTGFKKLPGMLWGGILYMLALIIGSLLLLLPGIILSLSLAFYPYLLVLRDEGGYQSLKTSHKLVWGNWWRTLTVFMVPGIIITIVIFMLGLLAGLAGALEVQGFNWVDIVSNLFMALYLPFFYCLGYVQYRDLEVRSQGGDLEARLAAN